MTCEVCRREKEILYAGTARIAIGENCYRKICRKNVQWDENVTLEKLRRQLDSE